MCDQQHRNPLVPVALCPVEWGNTFPGPCIDLGAMLNQYLCHLDMAFVGRQMQWRRARFEFAIDILAGDYRFLHSGRITIEGQPVHCTAALYASRRGPLTRHHAHGCTPICVRLRSSRPDQKDTDDGKTRKEIIDHGPEFP